MNDDPKFRMYEKAIEGRNLHYQSYNTWMNHYAIFTGAFFIAYYTIQSSENSDHPVLSLIIALLGYISAICWRYSLSGYYAWMISWIKLVQKYERLMHVADCTPFVYTYADSCLTDRERRFPQNFSTQRITAFFTAVVIIGWGALVVAEFYGCLHGWFGFALGVRTGMITSILLVGSWYDALMCFVLITGVTVGLYFLVVHWFSRHCRSDIDGMTEKIDTFTGRRS